MKTTFAEDMLEARRAIVRLFEVVMDELLEQFPRILFTVWLFALVVLVASVVALLT